MESFAEYILKEENYAQKLEKIYYLQKRNGIFLDNSVILKTELARMFMETCKLEVDINLVITTCLLYGCKKKKDATDINTIRNYAKEGATYLSTLGFDKRFCKICEEVNRYSASSPRESESDILELVDNFGGLVLDRPERRGFPIDEALVLTEYRNLKEYNNIFLEQFKEFISIEEYMKIEGKIEGLKQKEDFNGRISKRINLANEKDLSIAEMILVIIKGDEGIEEYFAKKTKRKVEEHKSMLDDFQS